MSDPNDHLMTAADLANRAYSFDEHQRGCEAAYRRGVHQALALAGDLVAEALTLPQARRRLARAEDAAAEYRSRSQHPGRPPLVDLIRASVLEGRRRARA